MAEEEGSVETILGKKIKLRTPEEVQTLKSQTEDAVRKINPVYDETWEEIDWEDTSLKNSAMVIIANRLREERTTLRLVHKACKWFLGEETLPPVNSRS